VRQAPENVRRAHGWGQGLDLLSASHGMSLRSKVTPAGTRPTRPSPALLPLLKTASAVWDEIPKGDLTPEQLTDIWGMFQDQLPEDRAEGVLPSTRCWRTTTSGGWPRDGTAWWRSASDPYEFAVKSGLLGPMAVRKGRPAIQEFPGVGLQTAGNYSAGLAVPWSNIAVKSGVPAVCSAYVPTVLNKPVVPSADGTHYKRSISGVGVVEKLAAWDTPSDSHDQPRQSRVPLGGGREAGTGFRG